MPSAVQQDQKYTYGDYAQWPDEERWELIDGVPHAMAAPSRLHQEIVFELGRQIGNGLLGSDCKGYVAPFDVRLPDSDEDDEEVYTTIQPDLLVVCDQDKLDDKGCRGAPDWIVEVISPSTALVDLNLKRDLYQKHGVKEYWIVHPIDRWVMVYLLDDVGAYGLPQVFGMDEAMVVQQLERLVIDWGFMVDGGNIL